MFNGIQVRGVRGLIHGVNTILFHPFPHSISSINRGIILHENELVVVEIEQPILKHLEVGVYSIPMLLRLEVSL
jgi:hypothetical protein